MRVLGWHLLIIRARHKDNADASPPSEESTGMYLSYLVSYGARILIVYYK